MSCPARLFVALVAFFAAGGSLHAQSLWELTPYQVQVYVVRADVPQVTAQLHDDVQASLRDRIDALIGASWDAEIAPAPASLMLAALDGLDDMAIDDLPAECLKLDKVIVIRLAWGFAGYNLDGRELDVRTRLWGTVSRAAVGQPARLHAAALEAMISAFAPLARVEGVKEGQASLRLRGGSLPPRDPGHVIVPPRTIFRPVVRFNDRDGELRDDKPPQIINWTYLRAESVDGSLATCQIVTGLRSPLTARRRGRTEQLALAVRPPDAPTTLVLTSRTDSKRRLFGYEVIGYNPEGTVTSVLGQSDRDGKLTIEPADYGLRVLVIKSGSELLARLPLVPGLESNVVAAVPDDDYRLAVEGYITGMQEEIVDLVARRSTLFARIRAHIKAGEVNEAQVLFDELKRLATRDELALALSEQRKKYFTVDPSISRKVDKLFADTREVLLRNLDPKQIDEIAAEVSQARKANPQAAGPAAAAVPTGGR